jgi:hypothetical protein
MKNIKEELVIWIYFLTPLSIWFCILFLLSIPIGINNEALSKIPDAITVFIVILFIFTQWVWRWPIWQGWLIRYPNLQGTWQGTLQTTWKNPETGQTPGAIPLVLVIKQTFDGISIVMYTQESTSYSSAAMLSEDDGSGIKRVSYNYTNNPDITIRQRSAIHHGAAILRIVEEEKKRLLVGEYWTSRNTAGNISLTLRTKKLIGSFPQDLMKEKTPAIHKKRK